MTGSQSPVYGYAGRILYIDLTKKEVTKVPLSQDLMNRFIGGRGLNMKLLFDELKGKKAKIDGLSPENPLILGTGPTVGTLMGSRMQASAISPLTGFIADANAGGHWPAELKFAGYDHVVIRGRSKDPAYIWINNDEVEIRDAKDLWGQNLWDTTEKIRELENDRGVQVLGIGQSGENQVRFAAILNSFARACGRGGLGAVMGSKNLKVVAVRGSKGIKVAKPKELLNLVKDNFQRITTHPLFQVLPKYGTPFLLDWKYDEGMLPIKNWTDVEIEGIDNVRSEAFVKKYARKSRACFGCFNHCDHFFDYKDIKGPGLEYESISAFGPRVGSTNFPVILEATNYANQYGLDVCSTGGSIGLAMDLYEKGIIGKKETDGLEMTWGNTKAILECVHKIANREGAFGNLLAEGPFLMAQKIAGKAPGRVYHAKGLDSTGVEWRHWKDWSLAYLTSTVGATHLKGLPFVRDNPFTLEQAKKQFGKAVADGGSYDKETKPKVVHHFTKEKIILDCMELCFTAVSGLGLPIGVQDWINLLNATTGMSWDMAGVDRVAARVNILEIAINAKQGYTIIDDMPGERVSTEGIARGPFKGETIEPVQYKKMLQAYYKIIGCNVETGIPTHERLMEVGLPEVLEEMKQLGLLAPDFLETKQQKTDGDEIAKVR